MEKYDWKAYRKAYEDWVARLESDFQSSKFKPKKFQKISVQGHYRGTNTAIDVVALMSDCCRLELALNFRPVEESIKEHGSILCVYGPLTEIRKRVSIDVEDWEKAIWLFKKAILEIDYSSFGKVKKLFKKLKYAKAPKRVKVKSKSKTR